MALRQSRCCQIGSEITLLPSIGIPTFNIRRSHDRLILNMGIPIPGKDGLYIKTRPWWRRESRHHQTEHCPEICRSRMGHDDVIKWKHFPRYWPFVRGIHRSQVNSPHKGQWRGALMFSLICVWIDGWVNNHEAGDLRRYRAHYDVTVMYEFNLPVSYIYRTQTWSSYIHH